MDHMDASDSEVLLAGDIDFGWWGGSDVDPHGLPVALTQAGPTVGWFAFRVSWALEKTIPELLVDEKPSFRASSTNDGIPGGSF